MCQFRQFTRPLVSLPRFPADKTEFSLRKELQELAPVNPLPKRAFRLRRKVGKTLASSIPISTGAGILN